MIPEELRGLVRWAVILVVGILVWVFLLSNLLGMLGYVLADVGDNEVGVKFIANNPYEVVPSGKYTEIGFFKTITDVRVSDYAFSMSDEEVLTKDKQRIGVVVTGTVSRPGRTNPHVLLENWSRYKAFYLDDALLVGKDAPAGKEAKPTPGLMQSLGQQAAKVCVGDLEFDKAVIGSARDILRECISKELGELAAGYGLTVSNIVVPNVVLQKAVQDQLDAITAARFNTQLAQQREFQATAEANRTLAEEQGKIRVEQGRVQEKAIQDKRTADLEKQVKEAQYSVIDAEKINTLLASQRDRDIADVNRQTAETNAKATLAPEIAKAELYQRNPEYTRYQETVARASAWKNTDKVIIPANADPTMIFGDKPVTVQVPQR